MAPPFGLSHAGRDDSRTHYAKGMPQPRRATTPCRHTVSGLFHSPCGVLFTFPSRYLFAIGHRLVFSLGGWAPRIRTGFHVSRPTWDAARAWVGFGYGAFALFGRMFQSVPLPTVSPTSRSRNPGGQAPRFGLFRVRSPLLAKSLLFSSPRGTEMFHFPGCRPSGLFHSTGSDGALPPPDCSIRMSWDQCVFATPPGFSQLTTSFVALRCQGIHRAPFRACA